MQSSGLGCAVGNGAHGALEDEASNGGDDNDRLELALEEKGNERDGGEVHAVNVDSCQ